MAGLIVLLEAHDDVGGKPQIVSKTTFLRPPFLPPPPPPPPQRFPSCFPSSAFLDACFLCRKHLSREEDVFMYRGDRAFCSVECRRRQIFMDEEESVRKQLCSLAAAPVRRHKRVGGNGRHAAAPAGGFAY